VALSFSVIWRKGSELFGAYGISLCQITRLVRAPSRLASKAISTSNPRELVEYGIEPDQNAISKKAIEGIHVHIYDYDVG
jgi:hypothetical protein